MITDEKVQQLADAIAVLQAEGKGDPDVVEALRELLRWRKWARELQEELRSAVPRTAETG